MVITKASFKFRQLKKRCMSKNSKANTRRSFILNVTKGVIGASIIPAIVTGKARSSNLNEVMRSGENIASHEQVQGDIMGLGG